MRPLLVIGILLMTGCRSGIHLTVSNGTDTTIRSLQVMVTGAEYMIDGIDPGERETVRVAPVGESHIEISHAGTLDTLIVDTYFEPGYTGRIWVRLEGDSLTDLEHEIGLY